MSACPSCGSKLGGMLSGLTLMPERKSNMISTMLEIESKPMCTKCGNENLDRAKARAIKSRPAIIEEVSSVLAKMPAATIHAPPGWDFQTLGVVSAQATMGTGVITEIVSEWTDFFGSQSKRHNAKLKQGEELCLAQIRSACFDQGGNGLVGIDIDYAEIGGIKAMLMVCITGTAIKMRNIEALYPESNTALCQVEGLRRRLVFLEDFIKEFGHA